MKWTRLIVVSALVVAPAVYAGQNPNKRLNDAAVVLREMMRISDKGVPQELIDRAQCVVVVPGLKKIAFIGGGKYGKGFAACRKASGAPGWSAPAGVIVEGGSVGFQIGVSEQDIILIVQNKSGQEKLLQDKFTIGADASAAAGPVGRNVSAQTDAQMHAEILSYSRSRGLFAGLSLEGATLREDVEANKQIYGRELSNKHILDGSTQAPASARSFEATLNRNSMHKEQ